MAKKSKEKLIILYIAIIIILLSIGGYGIHNVLDKDTIYEGVNIDKFNVSNMKKEKALKLIMDEKEKELDKPIKIFYGEYVYNPTFKQLGYYYDYKKAVEEAYSIGRKGNIISRLKEIRNVNKKGKKIELKSGYDAKPIDALVENISNDINLDSKDATYTFKNGRIYATDEIVGRKVDKELLRKMIMDNVTNLSSKDIEIPVEQLTPNLTKALLTRVNGLIGEFSTSFKGSSSERIENIKLASKAVDGRLIMPGETVSFNNITGPRSKEGGYKEANIIIGGDFTPGLGGGVCQVSTTLYNALLRANLKIVERYPHSIPSKYVEMGQDAAVSYGSLDLKFQNNFNFPVYIKMGTSGNKVYAYVYGDVNEKNYNVQIKSELVEKIVPKVETIEDKSLEPGQKVIQQDGRNGYRVKTYKIITKNGQVISKDTISSDLYKPRSYIYRVGPNKKSNSFTENNVDELDDEEND